MLIWSMACHGAETGTLLKIKNEWKVLKFDKGEGWRTSFRPIMWKIKEYYIQSCKKETSYTV